ncbi:MAG: UPF0175 family protein [Chloroflexi bacterium]|nr:UPF0175 family protein [Chloroflexota bacterium]
MKGIRESSTGPEEEAMVPVRFDVPAWVVEGRQMSPEQLASWARVAAAMFRYGRSEISFGTAAALAGASQAEFMRILKEHGQDTFVVDWDDFDRELVRAGVIDAPLHDDAE